MLSANKFFGEVQVIKECREEKETRGGGAGGMLIGLKVEKGMPIIDV